MVDRYELEAMKFFQKNRDKKEFIKKFDDFYQYAHPLYITKTCLKCHGKKEKAPPFIQKRYLGAYDYHLGDLRGIVSIKIPRKGVESYFKKDFFYSVVYDITLFVLLFIFIFYIFLKFRKINAFLSNKLEGKTKELREQNRYLNSHIKALDESVALFKTTPQGVITHVNDRFLKETGFSKEEVLGKTPSIIRHPQTDPKIIQNMWDTILQKKIWNGIVKGLTKDKKEFIHKIHIIPVLDEHDEIIEFIVPRIDITNIIKNREKLKEMLITDFLTSLPNRQKLIDDIKSNKNSQNNFLALFNIDSFKEINDFYGHKIADKVLILVAKRLIELTKDKDIALYKMPSDEYALYSTQKTQINRFYFDIQEIILTLNNEKIKIQEYDIFINFSCGIAYNEDNLLIKADVALQKSKISKKYIIIYSSEIDNSEQITDNIKKLKVLKTAIKDNNIVPYFQPIFNLHSNRIEKFECLARIKTKDKEVLVPFSFLDVAFKTKLYEHITKSMITKSFEYFSDKDYEFSINISKEDILNDSTKNFIFESLKKFNNPQRVVFEILESEEIANYEQIKDFIQDVKAIGSKIAIDDFGSGYSNFGHILELNTDYLKIDSSLVRYVKNNENSKQIVKTIVAFAKQLNLKTIAEFIEDKESLEILKELGCDYAQGYYIGKPESELKGDLLSDI